MLDKLNRPTALAIGAIALIIGAIGPWITFLGIISAGPTNFPEVALVVFGGIGLLLVSAITGRAMRSISIIIGVLVLVEAGYVWFQLSEKDTGKDLASEIGNLVAPGWGLYLSVFAGLFLIASTWIARKPTPMEKYHIRSIAVARMDDEV